MIGRNILLVMFTLCWSALSINGQEISEEGQDFIETVVMYDPDTRYDIFVVCSHHSKLPEIKKIQTRARKSFQSSIRAMPKKEQELVYNMMAQPGFASLLKEKELLDEARVAEIFKGNNRVNPTEAHAFIQRFPRTIDAFSNTWERANNDFNNLIKDLTEDEQRAFRNIAENPEIIEVLVENPRYAQRLGEYYAENPARVVEVADSLAIVFLEQNEAERAAYQQELDENQELREESILAAEAFARDFGYDPAELRRAQDEARQQPANVNITVVQMPPPYPFWFGPPMFMPHPMWRPHPWHWHCGWRFGPGGSMMVMGMPTFMYTTWFWGGPHMRFHASMQFQTFHVARFPMGHSGFHHGMRRNNVVVVNNNIHVNNRNTNINTGRYNYRSLPPNSVNNRPGNMPTNNANRPSTNDMNNARNRPNAGNNGMTNDRNRPSTDASRNRPNTVNQPAARPSAPAQRNPNGNFNANDAQRGSMNRGGAGQAGRPPASRPSAPASRPATRPSAPASRGR
jgi:hypothetical protein